MTLSVPHGQKVSRSLSSRKTLTTVLSCFFMSVVLGGCQPQYLNCVNKSVVSKDASDPFENVALEIGIDGSASMYGFVNLSGSLYSEAIQSLALLVGNRGIETRYWRIGGNSKFPKAISETEFLDGKTLKFYTGQDPKYPRISSTLNQIYKIASPKPTVRPNMDAEEDPVPPQVVRILLSDLEPNQSAIDQISKAVSMELKNNPGYTAMLLGVKSQYKGHIFTADTGKITIENYSTEGQNLDVAGRPFYILMTGPQKALEEIVKNLDQLAFKVSKSFRIASFDISNNSVITLDNSRFSLASSSSVDEQTESAPSCTETISSIGEKMSRPEEENQWLIFYQKSCDSPQNFQVKDLQSQPSFLLRGAAISKDLIQVDSPAVSLNQVALEGDRLDLNMTIDPNQVDIRKGGEIYLTIPNASLDQAVWSTWDTTVDKANGAKTQNLLPFISGLRLAVNEIAKTASRREDPSQERPPMNTQDAMRFCMGISP